MGLFDFFHNRRERESALPASQAPAQPESEPQSQSQSLGSVSYTHLTLPTTSRVYISVVAV